MSEELTFAERLSHSGAITVMYFVQLVMYTISLLSCIYLIYLLKKIDVFHPNLRILLTNWALAFIIISLTQLMTSIQILTLLFSAEINALQDLYYCQALNTIFYFGGYMACLNLLMLVVERIIATIHVKTYEKKTSPAMGYCFVIFQWITCGLVMSAQTVLEYQHGYQGRYDKIFSCEPIFAWAELFLIPISGVVIDDTFAMLTFIVLLFFNKRKYVTTFSETTTHSLSERYQIVENIKATRLLYPLVFSYAACSLLLCIDFFYMTLNVAGRTATMAEIGQMWIFTNIFYLILGVKANILPWLILFGHPTLKIETKKRIPILFGKHRIVPVNPRNVNGEMLITNQSSERIAHFTALDLAWSRTT